MPLCSTCAAHRPGGFKLRLLASCVTWSHVCSLVIPIPCPPPRARNGGQALPSSSSCAEIMHKVPAAARPLAQGVRVPHCASRQVFGRGTGTGSFSTACVNRNVGSWTPICYTHPSTLLGMDQPLAWGAQVKQIADISAAAAWVSERSSHL